MKADADVVIVGAGLTGLALARSFVRTGREVVVLEARDRVGGRVLTQDGFDLGPAWLWPHNLRMLNLVEELGLKTFAQHSEGRLVFQDGQGHVRRDLTFATMGDALRVEGGMGAITSRLAANLGSRVRLAHVVRQLEEDATGVTLSGDGFSLRAGEVVLAMPPRLAAQLGLSIPDVATWMAGHTKVVARYETPFWRADGLNGDAMSHCGPLVEIHDASVADGSDGALFGFAIPGAARRSDFKVSVVDQLVALFGAQAAQPIDLLIKDWSKDPATATESDLDPPRTHPSYRPLAGTARITLAGSETALEHGGFLEGALESAEAAFAKMERAAA